MAQKSQKAQQFSIVFFDTFPGGVSMSKYFCSEAQNSSRVAARGRGLRNSGPRGLRRGEIPLASLSQPRSSKRRLPGGVAVPPRGKRNGETTRNDLKRLTQEAFGSF